MKVLVKRLIVSYPGQVNFSLCCPCSPLPTTCQWFPAQKRTFIAKLIILINFPFVFGIKGNVSLNAVAVKSDDIYLGICRKHDLREAILRLEVLASEGLLLEQDVVGLKVLTSASTEEVEKTVR